MATAVPLKIACFITPHGYGHAARAAAVMEAITGLNPSARFEIFTRVPRQFFDASLSRPFGYHPLLTDIGLAQINALAEDLPETIRRLDAFLPFTPARLQSLARQVTGLNCRLVMCDISPLGIAVAQTAQLPAVLIENFTWDWIYSGYLPALNGDTRLSQKLKQHIAGMQNWYGAADYHLQTEPVCRPSPRAGLTTAPVSRRVRTPANRLRQQLGLPPKAGVVLITMGGIPWRYTFFEELTRYRHLYFIIPGVGSRPEMRHNLIMLPHHSGIFHPDLINAADVVIGKAGYSTLAEVYQAGVPFGYVARPNFRETPALLAYINAHMSGMAIDNAQFQDGSWLSNLPELLAMPRREVAPPNGARQAARFILDILSA